MKPLAIRLSQQAGKSLVMAAWPVIIANGITLLLAGTVLAMKIRFG